jgi:hypothetical protein
VVVECAEGVGNVEPVVPGVEGAVEPLVYVEGAVEPVLPCVNYEATISTSVFQVGNVWSRTAAYKAQSSWRAGMNHQ